MHKQHLPQPAQPRYADYWAPLMHKQHLPQPAQPRYADYWAPLIHKQFTSALELLGPPQDTPQPAVPHLWQASSAVKNATAVLTIAGLRVYVVPSNHRPECMYTDGSKCGTPPSAGAAAVLTDGRIAVCRVPGGPNSYKAELIGILLASRLSEEGERLRLDCQGAIASANGHKRPVRPAFRVHSVRASLSAKSQSLEWVEGHMGEEYNEVSDKWAKIGTVLPPPPPHQLHPRPPGT